MVGIKRSLQRRIVNFGPLRAAVLMALLVGASILFSVHNVQTQEQQAIEEYRRLSSSYAAAFAEYCELAVFGADQVLETTLSKYDPPLLTSPNRTREVSEWMRSKLMETRFLIGIMVTDQNGISRKATWPGGLNLNRKLSSSFYHHSREKGLKLRFWGQAIMPGTGRETIEVSRRLEDANGNFIGVLSGYLDADFFHQFFKNVNLPSHSIIGFYDINDKQLISVSMGGDKGGLPRSKSALLNQSIAEGLIVRQQALTRYPLSVRVELPYEPILKQYRKLGTSYGAFVLVLALMAVQIVLLVRTLSKRLNAEEQIRVLSLALENSPISIVITDAEGRIEYVNPYFSRQTGLGLAQARMKYPNFLKMDELGEDRFKRMWKEIGGGRIWQGELRGNRPDGQPYWETVAIAPIKTDDGEISHFVNVREDISLRKQAEYDLLRAKEMAEQANRAKSAFLANMSHELRTPLNAVLGFAELMLNGVYGAPNPRQSEALEDIHKSGRHLLDIINDVLDMSRIEAGRYELSEEAVDLTKIIQSALRMTESRAMVGNVKIKNEMPAEMPSIWGDERAIKQVLINLLGNAVKFTPKGGEVAIRSGLTDFGGLWISIADTGPGISQNDLERLFQPFQQGEQWLTRQHEGTGLGLAISKKLIELHGGSIHLESKLGVGTTVRLVFPPTRVHSYGG